MATPKDMSRPATQHRLSVGSHASSLPVRNAYNRTPSTSSANRINRRKSSTFSPVANAAVLGAAVEHGVADGSVNVNRRSSMTRNTLAALNEPGTSPMLGSLPKQASHNVGSALVDGPSLASMSGISKSQPKIRRASDGTRLTKKEKAATGDLKCETCGKAYKHGSCLTKHLWEHTPQWQVTSKLLISKHQQVQLLEAASVLVAMNGESPSNDSDSSSPAASGSSDVRDEPSSAETTPPPHMEGPYRDIKRYSGTSSAYSRSYQSFSESAPNPGNAFSHHRQWSASSNRPPTANPSIAERYEYGDEDPADLAAAVGLLSCSYGTPKTGPTSMPHNVPPVPPLPAKYAAPNFSTHRRQEDVDMDDDSSEGESQHPARIDEVDEGVFGKMD